MRSIFSPAIAVMNRLGYTKKFTLLALASTVAFAVVVYGLFASLDKEIGIVQRELEGIALVEHYHPDVHVFTPVVDQGLNAHKFIVPGLGDFGDRLYGTV